VGATRVLKLPSQAATVALAGDTIRIDPGTYVDCAVWRAPRLVIEATGPGVRLVNKVCADKGIFVVQGDDVTVRGLTFEGAKDSWHNGAGIRGLGENLTVEDSRFIDNEDGILTAGSLTSVVRVTGSTFTGNGACIGECAHGIYAGTAIRLLEIAHCTFLDQHTGHHIKSRAHNTVVEDSRIEDGPTGNSSYLIDVPNGGNVLIQDNEMEKGPKSENRGVAISIGVEGVTNQTDTLIIRNNRFRNDVGAPTTFVRNSTHTPAEVQDNTITGPVTLLHGTGGIPLDGL
jgi:nitrous oxidase accessory protein NosD